jgi:hypothetical protein
MKDMMKVCALALAMLPLAAGAYSTADTFEQAKTKLKDDGLVFVFVHADGWDKHSAKTVELMMKDSAVSKVLKDDVVMKLGLANLGGKEQDARIKERFGNLRVPTPDSIPGVNVYTKEGRVLASLSIPFKERKKPAALARRITELKKAYAAQNKLMAEAGKANGPEKARLLGEAAFVQGVSRPDNVQKMIKQADPEDKSGMDKVVSLNLPHYAIGTADTKDWQKSLAEVKELQKNPNFSKEQQQQLCCVAIGLLRRHGGMQYRKELKDTIARLREIDPDSILGKSAIDAERMWVRELNLIEGWSPEVIPAEKTPVEVSGPLPFKEAGTYQVSFNYQRGNHAARFMAVELYDGKTKVAEDRHNGSAGLKHSNNVYTLEVPKAVKKPRLYITFDMETNRDSYGRITVTKK